MKNKFHGYYRPDDPWFTVLWKNCLFAFDANIPLTLYAFSPDTRKQVLRTLNAIKDRVWIPYQAANEFHENRLSAIAIQAKKYGEMLGQLTAILNTFRSNQHPYISAETQNKLEELFETVRKELEAFKAEHEKLYDTDTVLDEVSTVFDGRVGNEFSEERLSAICAEGKKRFEKKMPPGYKDEKKPEPDRYGDLVIWKELVNKASNVAKPIVFITNEEKEDWWQIRDDRPIGPRAELRHEFTRATKQDFYMYTLEAFLRYAEKHLRQKVDEKVIEEVKELGRSTPSTKSFWTQLLERQCVEDALKHQSVARALSLERYPTPTADSVNQLLAIRLAELERSADPSYVAERARHFDRDLLEMAQALLREATMSREGKATHHREQSNPLLDYLLSVERHARERLPASEAPTAEEGRAGG